MSKGYYRVISLRGADQYESEIINDKHEAIKECKSRWRILSDFDKNKYSEFYVASYRTIKDAEEVMEIDDFVYRVK